METSTLKQKIHNLIDNSTEETLQSVYQLLQDEQYTDEFKKILEEEKADYLKNGNTISRDAMNSLVKTELEQ